jgi:hypothetical protein
MRRVDPADVTSWLGDATSIGPGGGYTGFDVDVWHASIWVLNAMYESEVQLPDLSANQLLKLQILAGEAEPTIINGVNLDERTITTGQSLGRSEAPGPGWQRLLWSELAKREGAPMSASGVAPCFRWFSYRSWPIRIRPFASGSLDRESFLRLAEVLIRQPGVSPDSRIWCYYSPLVVVDSHLETPAVLEATLAELPAVYDWPEVHGSPSNIWPDDRSWFVFSDYDLSGTRVSGTTELVASVVADEFLETTNWPRRGETDAPR